MISSNYTRVLIIGISGVTCGGKTTLAQELSTKLPKSKLFSQDDYFLEVDDPRHVWIPELNHINFDILQSLDMLKFQRDVEDFISSKELLVSGENISNANEIDSFNNSEDVLKLILEKTNDLNVEIIIIEGFCIFNYKPMLHLYHLKYYFTLSKDQCFQRRKIRVYEPPDCPGYFEQCVWPEHTKQLNEVRRDVPAVTYFNEHFGSVKQVLEDILRYLNAL